MLKKFLSLTLAALLVQIVCSIVSPVSASFDGIGGQSRKGNKPLKQTTILIWKVGSPYDGHTPEKVIPLDLVVKAKALRYHLEMETFPAKGFAPIFFDAVLNHTEPDILAFDNYGIIDGATTRLGRFAGIGSSRLVSRSLIVVSESFKPLQSGRGGWEYLISTSRNHNQAKALALGKPECNPDFAGSVKELERSLLNEIKAVALEATRAYYDRKAQKLEELSGGEYTEASLRLPDTKQNIIDAVICGVWGNERIAFVNSLVSFEAEKSVGQKNMLVVLRRSDAKSWNLLLTAKYPNVIQDLYRQVPELSREHAVTPLKEPALINPPDQARFENRFPRSARPDIEWSAAGNGVAAYMVDSQFLSGRDWSSSSFEVIPASKSEKETVKVKAYFGVGAQPHRWRIWAIGKNGEVRISTWRTIIYTR